ncbi:MAG TPA: hypothetical protein VL854_09745 [Nitrososphaeraceae archaeon]|nr:hypothetical protein [Nitrososphaeraceae archaeon]
MPKKRTEKEVIADIKKAIDEIDKFIRGHERMIDYDYAPLLLEQLYELKDLLKLFKKK